MKYKLQINNFLLFIILISFTTCTNSQVINNEENGEIENNSTSNSIVSILKEPYDIGLYSRKVFDDFSSINVKGISDLNSNTASEIRILKLVGDKEFKDFLSKKLNLEYLEALQIINGKIETAKFEELMLYLANKDHLKKIILFNCEISTVPPSINKLKQLETLDLSRNNISYLPNEIIELSNLKYLRLYNNESFTVIPSEIGSLSKLEHLDFAGTNVSIIPTSIGKCSKLFNITGNACKIKTIPKELGNCKNLKSLNLGANQITELPVELGQLAELEIFSFGSNQIREIPNEYERLTKLITFAVDNNQLSKFPEQILNSKKLLNLWVHKNQIKDIPIEVANLKRLMAFIVDENEFTSPKLEEIRKQNPRLRVITRY